MTTIVDPAGSPSVILIDPSITVDTVSAAGSNAAGATQLTRHSNVNVVAVNATAPLQGIKLPPADEGDYFELFSVDIDPSFGNPYSLKVYDNSGSDTGGNFFVRTLRFVNGAWRIVAQY